jgi:2-keto-3-deoxy-L-fuconate dehydrogenase
MKLKDQVAIVTGGGSGIGRAAALCFAREGACVAIVDRESAAASATVDEIAKAGGSALPFVCDVGASGAADTVAQAAEAKWGQIDILLTAAGFSVGGTVLTTSPADWQGVFDVHVGGTWLFARAVIPSMQRVRRGSIITVASQLAVAGGRGNSSYIAAKGAILSLTRTMAMDFADDGIRVNALVPGAIDTPMLNRSFKRHADPVVAREASRRRHPLGRFGRPEEVAQAALYLASDASAFSTGTSLVVDGGWLAG